MKYLSLLALLVVLSGCSIVGPGEKGVRIFLGEVKPETLSEGVYLWVPLVYKVKTLDVRIQKSEVETTAASKDMQDVVTKFALNWHLNSEKVAHIYQQIGNEEMVLDNVISPAISEVLKASTAKKTAEEILTKRAELKEEIDQLIKARMLNYNIVIDDINIVNVKFSADFVHAIEQKQIAEQRAKQADYEALRAEKDAQSEVNRAKGQAEAQRLLQKTLTQDVLTLEYLKKWNGVLPSVLTGGSSSMMFNLKMHQGQATKE